LPVLEAVSRLCRQTEGKQVFQVLRRVSPTWLVQLPALLDEAEYAALQQKVAGATRERMLREMADALETLTAISPLVLVLEDLHWSDASTVDLLAMVARRREPARLLILGTYRPAELIVMNHPLKQLKHELVAREQGREIPLTPLAVKDVQAYLTRRFSAEVDAQALTSLIYRRTEGHPLFMVQIVDYLMQREAPRLEASALTGVAQALPQGLRELIEAQVGRLTIEERQVLETASVVGAEFAAASVAAGLERAREEIEIICEQLAQRGQFISEREVETWPDGTVSGRYGFGHALYQDVLYQRLSVSRRMQLHRRIGEWEETAYGARARAAELAVHFERGRDIQRAVQYLRDAGKNAMRRGALQEAITLFTKGLALLNSMPESPERIRQELQLHLALSAPLMMMKGYTAPEVEQLYTRALALCRHVEQPPLLFSALTGLISFHIARAEFHEARALGAQCLHLARRMPGVLPHLQAVTLLGVIAYYLGEFVLARQYLEEGLAQCASQTSFASVAASQPSLLVTCFSFIAVTLCALGYPAQALTRSQEALAVARAHARPTLLALALHGAFWVRPGRREVAAAHEHAEALVHLCREQGFPFWSAWGQTHQGWVLIEQGQVEAGMLQIRQGLGVVQAAGAEGGVSDTLAFLAKAVGNVGQREEGMAILDTALRHVSQHGERYYEAEIYRLKGELLLQANVR
jgi:tetratricopeptide (TPR) repeat protein